jgi:hypothetical protein
VLCISIDPWIRNICLNHTSTTQHTHTRCEVFTLRRNVIKHDDMNHSPLLHTLQCINESILLTQK